MHGADLRHGDVRLVDDQQEVVREVVDEGGRGRALRAAVDVPGVVLDARAESDLPHHLDVVGRAHAQPLRLQQLALRLELGQPLPQFLFDAADRPFHPVRPGHVVGGREDPQLIHLADHLTGQRVQVVQLLHLVAEELDAHRKFLVRRDDLHRVPAHPETTTGERQVVAGVLDVDQRSEQQVTLHGVADLHRQRPVQVRLRGTQAVDAGHRRHHYDVPPGQQRHGCRVPQPFHIGVDRGVLLDVGVGLRDVGLRLVVVVVRDEVLDRVLREQFTQLVGQLGGERLVRRHHQRRPLHPFDQPRGGRRLTGAGRAEQHDVLLPSADPPFQIVDRLRLVAGRTVIGHHPEPPVGAWDVPHRSIVGDGEYGMFGRESHRSTVRGSTDSASGTTISRAATTECGPPRPRPRKPRRRTTAPWPRRNARS